MGRRRNRHEVAERLPQRRHRHQCRPGPHRRRDGRRVNTTSGALFRNESTVEHVGGNPVSLTGPDARIENAALWDIQGDGGLVGFTAPVSVFANEASGTLRKSGGTGASVISSGALRLDNAGVTEVQTGELRIDVPSAHTDATFAVSAGALLRFGSGGAAFFGTLSGDPAGILQIDDSFTAPDGATWDVGGTGVAWLSGYLSDGTVTNVGLVRIGGGSVVGVNTTSSALFRNESTVEHVGDTPVSLTGADARIENAALWDIQGNGGLEGFTAAVSVFANEASGTFRKSGGTGASVLFGGALRFENAGVVSVESGEIDVNRPFDHQAGATIQGTGIFDVAGSALTFAGDVGPGASPGLLTWQTAYEPLATSSLRIELGGTTAGTDYDQLAVAGAAALAGDLVLSIADGATPMVGDSYTILTAASVAGEFGAVLGPDGYDVEVAYSDTDVVVTITAITVAEEDDAPAVFETALLAPAPNPTRGATALRYTLNEAGPTTVSVYDLLGRVVAVAAQGDASAGEHTARLNTSALAPGIYVVRMAAPGFDGVQRLTVVR